MNSPPLEGSLDLSLQTDSLRNFSSIYSIDAVQTDGRIWLHGDYPINPVVRISADGTEREDVRFGSYLAISMDGGIFVGSDWPGAEPGGVRKLFADRSPDPGFHPITQGDVSLGLALLPDGRILTFQSLGGLGFNIHRYTAQGIQESMLRTDPFDLEYEFNLVERRPVVAEDAQRRLIFGARKIERVDGAATWTTNAGIFRLNLDGKIDSSFANPFNHRDSEGNPGQVLKIAALHDGRILVGGFVHMEDERWKTGVARLNENGLPDPGFPSRSGRLLGALPDGRVVIAKLDTNSALTHTEVIRQDGSIDESAHSVRFEMSGIGDSRFQPDGKLLVAGGFSSAEGLTNQLLIRLNFRVQHRLSSIAPLASGELRVRWTAPINEPHTLQSSPDLRTWTTVMTTNGTSPYFQLDLPSASANAVFFRVVGGP